MATFETTFKLPLFCHFTLVSSLWQEILFTPVLHFNAFKNCLWDLAFPVWIYVVHWLQLMMMEKERGAKSSVWSAGICLCECISVTYAWVLTSSPAAWTQGSRVRVGGPGSCLTSCVTSKDSTSLSLSFLAFKMNLWIPVLRPPWLCEAEKRYWKWTCSITLSSKKHYVIAHNA